MLKRIDSICSAMIRDRAIMRTATSYHDGEVNCRIVSNSNTNKRYFMQGQLVRDCVTGRFVSLKEIMQ